MCSDSLRRIFFGNGAGADWGQPGQRIHADADGENLYLDGPRLEKDFSDGFVSLASGSSGTLSIEPRHTKPAYLIPQSLNLLLSQQWARSALMTLHAAAFRFANRGILVLGNKASGKSVLTANALRCGGEVCSDDWMLLGACANGFAVERLRGFLMLRDGWATQKLTPGLAFQENPARPKTILRISGDDRRFPAGFQIDQLWLLRRSRGGRRSDSVRHAATASAALPMLVAAGMPLLFSSRFPYEHAAQSAMLRALLKRIPVSEVETGTDLVEQPETTLERLIGKT